MTHLLRYSFSRSYRHFVCVMLLRREMESAAQNATMRSLGWSLGKTRRLAPGHLARVLTRHSMIQLWEQNRFRSVYCRTSKFVHGGSLGDNEIVALIREAKWLCRRLDRTEEVAAS